MTKFKPSFYFELVVNKNILKLPGFPGRKEKRENQKSHAPSTTTAAECSFIDENLLSSSPAHSHHHTTLVFVSSTV